MPTLLQAKETRSRRAVPVLPPPSRAFRVALPWLLASLAATMATLVGQVPIWTLLSFAACAGWRLFTDRWHRALPSLLLRLVVFVPMAFGIVFTYSGHIDAGSMLAFLVALMSLKILELRSARDFTVVSLLGFFMTLSAFFYSQSLALFGFLSLALFANLVALLRCHGAAEGRSVWPAVRLGLGIGAPDAAAGRPDVYRLSAGTRNFPAAAEQSKHGFDRHERPSPAGKLRILGAI